MSKPTNVLLLVEDLRHRQFTYRYLRKLGFRAHDLRFKMSPSGSGSAEQWVREQFPVEYVECRRRNTHVSTRLVIVLDADSRPVQDRMRELDQSLQAAQVPATNSTDALVIRLIPKRNIETWILCLNDIPVEETTNYKNRAEDWTKRITEAITTLYSWTRQNASVPDSCVQSLHLGLPELRKLE